MHFGRLSATKQLSINFLPFTFLTAPYEILMSRFPPSRGLGGGLFAAAEALARPSPRADQRLTFDLFTYATGCLGRANGDTQVHEFLLTEENKQVQQSKAADCLTHCPPSGLFLELNHTRIRFRSFHRHYVGPHKSAHKP